MPDLKITLIIIQLSETSALAFHSHSAFAFLITHHVKPCLAHSRGAWRELDSSEADKLPQMDTVVCVRFHGASMLEKSTGPSACALSLSLKKAYLSFKTSRHYSPRDALHNVTT